MKFRNYLIGVAVVLASLVAVVVVAGGSLLVLVDLLAFLLLILFTLPTSLAAHGWKGYWGSYRLAFSEEPASRADYGKAIAVLDGTVKKLYPAAFVGALIGFLMILVYMNENTGLVEKNVNYAVSLLAVFYALIIHMVFLEPIRSCLRRKYASTEV